MLSVITTFPSEHAHFLIASASIFITAHFEKGFPDWNLPINLAVNLKKAKSLSLRRLSKLRLSHFSVAFHFYPGSKNSF